jgi:Fe-S cluster assembly protein SufD
MNAEVRHMKTQAELALADAFAAAQPLLPGDSRIAAERAAAFASFSAVGLPHRRIEAWKYTDLRALMRDAKPLAAPPNAAAKASAKGAGRIVSCVDCQRLIFVDGFFAPELSNLTGLEDGVTIRSMAEALASRDPLVSAHLGKVSPADDPALALNTAFMGDGAVIQVAPGARLARPLHLAFVTTSSKPAAIFMRSLAVIERGACATLIETHEGPKSPDYQVNGAIELVVEEDAELDHFMIMDERTAAIHIATLLANIGARARFNDFSFMAGGAVVRNQLFIRFSGERATAGIRGASLLAGRQHADITLKVDHMARDCESRQVFKSVLDGESRSVFQGKITVRPNAQKTDARMMTRALLLSDGAEADSKPELEIFADDVQCGHGSTAGALDEELKFYLMARGIPAKEAEALLIEAFVGEAVEGISHEGVRHALMSATKSWLRERG